MSEGWMSSKVAMHVALTRTPGGEVHLPASRRHRIRLHLGAPLGGRCRAERFLYKRGDLDLIPSGVADDWQQDSESNSLSLELAPSLLERATYELGLRASVATVAPRHQFRDPAIEHIVRALYAAQADGPALDRLYVQSLGLALAARLWPRSEPRTPSVGLSKPTERRVLAYIEEHLGEDLSLLQLANVADRGASQFKVLFKRSLGHSVHDYVIRRRVERARELVINTDRPLAQIAFELGFAHQSHMARCMRRVLGTTPGALRRESV